MVSGGCFRLFRCLAPRESPRCSLQIVRRCCRRSEACYFAVCGRRWCEATRRVVERGACVSVCQLVETRFSEEFRGRGQRARSQRAHPARTQRNWEKQKPCPPAVGIVDWLCWLRACHKRRDHSSPARYPRGLSLDRIALQVTLGRFTAMQLAWPRPHITHRRDDLTETYLLGVLGEYPTTTMVAVGAEPDTPQYQLQQVTCFKGSKQLATYESCAMYIVQYRRADGGVREVEHANLSSAFLASQAGTQPRLQTQFVSGSAATKSHGSRTTNPRFIHRKLWRRSGAEVDVLK